MFAEPPYSQLPLSQHHQDAQLQCTKSNPFLKWNSTIKFLKYSVPCLVQGKGYMVNSMFPQRSIKWTLVSDLKMPKPSRPVIKATENISKT